MKNRVYLAGPMRGYPLFNFPAFMQVAMKLREAGFIVANPAERDIAAGFDPSKTLEENAFSMRDAFLYDFNAITHADKVVYLPGWRKSSGSKAERVVAYFCEVPCFEYVLDPGCSWGFELREIPRGQDVPEVSLVTPAAPLLLLPEHATPGTCPLPQPSELIS